MPCYGVVSLRRLPFEMMFSGHRRPGWFRLEIKHVFAKVIHLRLVKLGRENGIGRELEELQGCADARDDGVGLDAFGNDLLE